MALNLSLVHQRFQDIRDSLDRLDVIAQQPLEVFLADQDMRDVASYRLLIAIEAAIQLCFHVSAHRVQRVPEGYADCFALLGEAGVVPEELSRRLQQMAQHRSQYAGTFTGTLTTGAFAMLQANLDDLRAFVQALGELL